MRAKPAKPQFVAPRNLAANMQQGKELPHIKKWRSRAKKIDICMSDVVVKQRSKMRRIGAMRREVLNELMPAMLTMHDVLTGILPHSCITSLSNQLSVTTYGQAQYKNGQRVKSGGKKKPSISRMSRAIKMLAEYGLIVVEYDVDRTTGEYLPSIIRLTERFYKALHISDEELAAAKRQRIAYINLKNKYGTGLTYESLNELAELKMRELRRERQQFRRQARLAKKVKAMSNKELHQKAQRIVTSMFSQPELECMTDAQFIAHVNEQKRLILNQAYKSPPNKYSH